MNEEISPEQQRDSEERAFLEGALGALQLVDEALDSVEKKLGKVERLPGPALNLLREKLDKIVADVTECHHFELKKKLIAAAGIFVEESTEEIQQQTRTQ